MDPWIPKTPEMKSFSLDVLKAFSQHAGPKEGVSYHGPETHGYEPLHEQFTLIDRANGNAFKIKLPSGY